MEPQTSKAKYTPDQKSIKINSDMQDKGFFIPIVISKEEISLTLIELINKR